MLDEATIHKDWERATQEIEREIAQREAAIQAELGRRADNLASRRATLKALEAESTRLRGHFATEEISLLRGLVLIVLGVLGFLGSGYIVALTLRAVLPPSSAGGARVAIGLVEGLFVAAAFASPVLLVRDSRQLGELVRRSLAGKYSRHAILALPLLLLAAISFRLHLLVLGLLLLASPFSYGLVVAGGAMSRQVFEARRIAGEMGEQQQIVDRLERESYDLYSRLQGLPDRRRELVLQEDLNRARRMEGLSREQRWRRLLDGSQG